ncbi:hypothetical protein LX95_01255 [Mesonia algae]|uniref:Uncharacterized protein n=1 Tax=Mesonia algae TaxID=213248 RepID=A0A2W7I4G5_9FLAO|nr:hypothetical protein [Mesonia algae]PZW41574.1 hypothetical protein LX95_01255 [Mesonia algae]
MPETYSHTTHKLKLNGQRVSRDYTAILSNIERKGKKIIATKMAWEFRLEFFGLDNEGELQYTLTTQRRFFLNERNSLIKKLNKAQTIALQVASINDELRIVVSKNYKLLEVKNTQQIRDKWEAVKTELLDSYPDLKEMAADFDWQLQESEIQNVFLNDNFYNFLFANIFYREFEGNSAIKDKKILANGLGNIDVPIQEEKKITKQDITFSEVTIELSGELDTEAKNFPLAKMNAFLGSLSTEPGSQHNLDFEYHGSYELRPEVGLIINGQLSYTTSIGDLYRKETTITFKLEDDG